MKQPKGMVQILLKGALASLLAGFASPSAHALPAFALREKVSCSMCHTNGSLPHLTHYGYLYRRAGFRPPANIGNRESDDKAMTFQEHMAAGVNLDYEYLSNTPPGSTKSNTQNNNINVPEVEVWPLVGSFLGNFGFWTEIDATPGVAGGGGINLSQADMRYASGNADVFFNFRGGIMATEGFGASDQWLDDSNSPMMDRVAPYYNQDTASLPFGAMGAPQLGLEFGFNYFDSHLTLGVFNGFTATNGIGTSPGTAVAPLTPALMNQNGTFARDYKVQLDQFVGEIGAITAGYYHGNIPLMDPTGNTFQWMNHYDAGRLYLTWFALPATLDIMAGGALAKNDWVTTSPTPSGSFLSKGAFLGTFWYVMPHLTLGARYDLDSFNTKLDAPAKAQGYSLQVSMPFENNLYVFHFNSSKSDLSSGSFQAGNTNDFRAEWRFLF